MDPRRNPYAPGAGSPPPELWSRHLIESAAIALDRIRGGLAAKSMLMVGLRGVGKTVLLNRIGEDGEAVREQKTALALLVDELQHVVEADLAALIMALHRAAQRSLPVVLLGAGLPQLVGRVAAAKTYAERLFSFPEIGPLPDAAARLALEAPARRLGVAFQQGALASILRDTACYPYFLQEWGQHCWDWAEEPTVTVADAQTATATATAELDAGFFRAGFDRLTPAEKRYLRAMAERGAGPHRSGEVAAVLGRNVGAVAPTRAKLIGKGIVYSPAHGDTAFTVPLFDAYLRRVLPLERG